MLGQKDFKPRMFHTIQLEDLVPKNHELREILRLVDFSSIRQCVKDKYSHTGQPSVDPLVVIKMLFLGYYYGVSSERQLAKDIFVNTAYRWFLGYDLDEATPTHSVLSKARTRFGIEVFQNLFDKIVDQCIKAGLVGGKRAFVDATLIVADASEEKLVPRIQIMTPKEYTVHMMPEEKNADENKPGSGSQSKDFNAQMVSLTDPDASYISRGKKSGLNYEGHYIVDDDHKVIVAVDTTNTIGNASNSAPALIQKALFRHGIKFQSLCADAEYGTQKFLNFLYSEDITAYIPIAEPAAHKNGLFNKADFMYEPTSDSYECPAGQRLRRVWVDVAKNQVHYQAQRKDCAACGLKKLCTTSDSGKRIKRLFFEDCVERAKLLMQTAEYKQNMSRRRVTVEPLFSEAKGSHGLSRAKYRRRHRVGIQVLWTATVQNIKRLLKASTRPPQLALQAIVARMENGIHYFVQPLVTLLNCPKTLSIALCGRT